MIINILIFLKVYTEIMILNTLVFPKIQAQIG